MAEREGPHLNHSAGKHHRRQQHFNFTGVSEKGRRSSPSPPALSLAPPSNNHPGFPTHRRHAGQEHGLLGVLAPTRQLKLRGLLLHHHVLGRGTPRAPEVGNDCLSPLRGDIMWPKDNE